MEIENNKIEVNKAKERRKEQNQRYYAKHRAERLEKIKEKKECDLCHKLVSSSNMNRHQKGGSCLNKDCTRKKKVSEIQSLKNQINELKSKINKAENKHESIQESLLDIKSSHDIE